MCTPQDEKTRTRLLHAAKVVFASDGLEKATVRKIITLAKTNIAAVNYHFGSKENLYVAVLRDYLEQRLRRNPRDGGVHALSTPRERLRVYVRSVLAQFTCDDDPVSTRLGKLLAQEFIQSSSRYFHAIIDDYCGPSYLMLVDILKPLLPGADKVVVSRCAASILGQCVLYGQAKEVINAMSPVMVLNPGNVDAVADFIVEFTLGGIERLNVGRAMPALS